MGCMALLVSTLDCLSDEAMPSSLSQKPHWCCHMRHWSLINDHMWSDDVLPCMSCHESQQWSHVWSMIEKTKSNHWMYSCDVIFLLFDDWLWFLCWNGSLRTHMQTHMRTHMRTRVPTCTLTCALTRALVQHPLAHMLASMFNPTRAVRSRSIRKTALRRLEAS